MTILKSVHQLSNLLVLQMVKLLLNKGANLSAIDKKERQPIHCAAYLGEWLSFSLHCCTELNFYVKSQ